MPGAPACPRGLGHGKAADPQHVDRVSALLVDQDGEPLGLEPVQVCGTDLCIFGESSEAGRVLMTPVQAIRKPAFKFGEGKTTAKFAWLLPDDPVVDLETVRGVRLPELGLGSTLEPGRPASSGGLTLLAQPGTRIRFDTIVFRTDQEKQLRAVQVSPDTAPAVVDPAFEFEIIYATTPTDTEFCPPAALRVENSPGWPANSPVEVWLHGTDITEEWAPYGGWAKVSEARVSDDGDRVETTDPGLPVLGILGFRRP